MSDMGLTLLDDLVLLHVQILSEFNAFLQIWEATTAK